MFGFYSSYPWYSFSPTFVVPFFLLEAVLLWGSHLYLLGLWLQHSASSVRLAFFSFLFKDNPSPSPISYMNFKHNQMLEVKLMNPTALLYALSGGSYGRVIVSNFSSQLFFGFSNQNLYSFQQATEPVYIWLGQD